MAEPNKKPVITAFDRNWEIQPILNSARSKNNNPVRRVIAATKATAESSSPDTPAAITALAATAANAELGPVAIWRDVPNMAYKIAPAAAA